MTAGADDGTGGVVDVEAYLARIGLSPGDVATPDRDALERLQRAHVTSVPFETLSVAGDPFEEGLGEGVVLDDRALHEKVVERRRGGFCYELNGLFAWLLEALGYEVTRCAARVTDGEGGFGPPADHLALVVALDRPHLVDVGVGAPMLRRALALPADGRSDPEGGATGDHLTSSLPPDEAGVEWRVRALDRPDADYLVQYREPGDGGAGGESGEEGWADRYIFDATPRDLAYFRATCDYHQSSPDSHFTDDPFVTRATADGHVSLSAETLTRTRRGEVEKEPVEPGEWHDVLASEFGLEYPTGTGK